MAAAAGILANAVVAAALLGLPCAALAQGTNLGFETPSPGEPLRPHGWEIRLQQGDAVLDTVAREGVRSLRLTSAGGFASAMQTLPAASVEGPRVRLSAYVRTEDVRGGAASVWVAVVGAGQQILLTAHDEEGGSGTQGWIRHSVEAHLPPGAAELRFGVRLTGAGTAWFDAMELGSVPLPDTPLPDSVRTYLEHALHLMQTRSLRRDSIDWDALRAGVMDHARGARSYADIHPVLQHAVRLLGDRHSMFFPPPSRVSGGMTPAPRPPRPGASPTAAMIRERIGYLWVPGFAGGDPSRTVAFADTLQTGIAELEARGACGWVVDLRGNTGGNMWPMLAGVGPVLGAGTAGSFVEPDGARTAWGYAEGASRMGGHPVVRASGDGHRMRDPDPPVAVLTGPRTASSGEAVAVAFRGRPHTRSFGEPTAGLSTSNASIPLADGAMLILTTAVFADRTGRAYGGTIEPDVVVEGASIDVPSTDDAVVTAAAEWLRLQPACRAGPAR